MITKELIDISTTNKTNHMGKRWSSGLPLVWSLEISAVGFLIPRELNKNRIPKTQWI